MERDLLAWVVDIATVVVGAAALGALCFNLHNMRAERRRWDEAWGRQVALDQHARIYEAAAALIAAVTAFSRKAETRVSARKSAMINHGYELQTDETNDPMFAAMLDRLGGPLASVIDALDSATSARHRLYFLIPAGGDGQKLLNDLILIGETLTAVRPQPGNDGGKGHLVAILDGTGLRADVEMLVSTDSLGLEDPIGRLTFVRELVERYFVGRIGRFVEPPPLARLP